MVSTPVEELLHLVDHVVEVDHPRPDDLAAGEREQLVGQRRGPLGGPLDLPDVAGGRHQVTLGAGGEFLDDERGIVEDHGEQVVEVVRDAAGELTEDLQALALLQLRLQVVDVLLGLPPLGIEPRLGLLLGPVGVLTFLVDLLLEPVGRVAGLGPFQVDLDLVPVGPPAAGR